MQKKLLHVIQAYKENFVTVNEQERYKWEAIAWYKNHWDIESPHFAEMIASAFSKAYNLLAAGKIAGHGRG